MSTFALMSKGRILLLLLAVLLAEGLSPGQEVLKAARIRAKGGGRNFPSLGLPVRTVGEDPVVWYKDRRWRGAESMTSVPFWTLVVPSRDSVLCERSISPEVLKFCQEWIDEKPAGGLELVWGPFQGGYFVALCKKTRSSLGWKSIGLVISKDGMDGTRGIYHYSRSVNWIEHQIGYNLFPRLPRHLQEIIEEMTATELLCPFQEYDPRIDDGPDHEVDYDMEEDAREIA